MSHHVQAYEGSEPFIFISYAHKDTEMVLPILKNLTAKGYRLWYDDGIAPGSEWPEYIANHLNGCQAVLAFISPNSIASPNCRREVTYALSKNKTFLGLILEPTKMSAGMEMQLSAQQCILRYNYIDPATGKVDEKRFLEKLFSVNEIQGCREIDADELEAAIRREREAANAAVARVEALKRAEAEKRAAEEAAKELERVQEEMQAAQKAQKAASKEELSSGKNKLLIPIIAGAAVVVLALVLVLGRGSGKADPSEAGSAQTETDSDLSESAEELQGSITYPNEKSVLVDHMVIDAGVIEEIAQREKLINLEFIGCVFKEADLTRIPTIQNWDSLAMTDCKGLAEYGFLAQCEKLSKLTLENCGIEDGMITEIANLRTEQVYLKNNHISDPAFLDALTRLTEIDLSGNPITSLSCAAKSADTLRRLHVSDTKLDAGYLKEFAGCKELIDLQISGIAVEDLSCAADMGKLEVIHAEGCGLKNIDGLTDKPELKYVYLAHNDLTSTAALKDLQGAKYSIFLDLHDNEITDWTLPQKLRVLLAYGNTARTGESFADKLANDLAASLLVCDYEDVLLDVSGRGASLSDQHFVLTLLPLDTPGDKQLDLKDSTDARCLFLTTEQFEEVYAGTESIEELASYAWSEL